MRFWTIGHSTRSSEEFVAALAAYEISLLVDVRKLPGSRRLPQFNQETLRETLAEADIMYEWYPDLGGRRKGDPQSQNTAWRNASFRAYADYMETAEFAQQVARLIAAAEQDRVAFMCAEVLWWQCHRALISDYLKAAGHEVIHIQDAKKSQEHPYTSAAKIVDGKLSYRDATLF